MNIYFPYKVEIKQGQGCSIFVVVLLELRVPSIKLLRAQRKHTLIYTGVADWCGPESLSLNNF